MINLDDVKHIVSMRIRGSGPDFDDVFYKSVNQVIRDLILETVLSVHEFDEKSPPQEINLPSKYEFVFLEGVPYYMQRMAKWARQEADEVSDAFYRRALGRAQVMAIEDDPEVPMKWSWKE